MRTRAARAGTRHGRERRGPGPHPQSRKPPPADCRPPPAADASRITDGAVRGDSAASLPTALAQTVTDSSARAFTDAVHLGLLVGGITLLVVAIPTAVFVRHSNAPAPSPSAA